MQYYFLLQERVVPEIGNYFSSKLWIVILVTKLSLHLNTRITFLLYYSSVLIQLTEAFAHVRVLIYENFGGYDVAEGQEGGDEIRVAEFLRQVIDKEVATFGTLDLLVCVSELRLLRCRRRSGCSCRKRGKPWNPNALLMMLVFFFLNDINRLTLKNLVEENI